MLWGGAKRRVYAQRQVGARQTKCILFAVGVRFECAREAGARTAAISATVGAVLTVVLRFEQCVCVCVCVCARARAWQ